MKYANDPFWVRLRTFLFVLFWVVWVAMLVGAVLIIALAPGCPATASLPWWKKCSLARVDVQLIGPTPKEKLVSAAYQLRQLKKGLSALKDANLDGLLISGLEPFLLDPELNGNGTEGESEDFRSALADLNSAVHGDEVKAKILYTLTLDETSTKHDWFVRATAPAQEGSNNVNGTNGNEYTGFYIWRPTAPRPDNQLRWHYAGIERNKLYGSRLRSTDQMAVLNYGDAKLKEKMRGLVLNWVRTKVDGIQVDGDFYADVPEQQASPNPNFISPDAFAEVRKWVKTGGENKALLVTGSSLTDDLRKNGEDGGSFELAPETKLWESLTKADNLRGELKKLFETYAEQDKVDAARNMTASDGTTIKEDVGAGWRAFTVDYPANRGNKIGVAHGLTQAEAVLTAFHLLPKSNPIILTENGEGSSAAETLAHLGSNKLLSILTKLRKEQSESFMLGTTQLPDVVIHSGSGENLAVVRHYKDKNAYLLVINFSKTSQEVEVKLKEGSHGADAALTNAKVVLSDSQNLSIVGKEVAINKLKLEPSSFLLVELALKD